MAVAVFPDSCGGGVKSPRISFSHDLPRTDHVVLVEQHVVSGPPSSSDDFHFCAYRASLDQESSSADELFSGGRILPTDIKKRLLSTSRTSHAPPPPPPPPIPPPLQLTPPLQYCLETAQSKNLSAKASSPESESEDKEKNHKPCFWSFKRSASLSCSSGYARRLCPLPVFARSNSTGSAASAKHSNNQKQNTVLKNSANIHSEKSNSASYSYTTAANQQRPPLKKTNNSSNNGIKVNPVLNIPLANIFGFGYIFSGGKDKNKKKYY
ncbi:uncharacterized protein [Henckelia pumila]|uniref:uncharacterized protein n=1 Tax=Henckelia pumila TaxID=405737 RepID=UPI003C6E466B